MESTKINSRYEAWLASLPKNTGNHNFICFISDMVTKYTGVSSALDTRRRISNHDDFTKFIWQQVKESLKAGS